MDRLTRAGRSKRDESFGLPAGQVAGFAVLFATLLVLLFLSGNFELVLGLVVAAAGAGKLVIGQLEAHENDELPPASRKFRELADPSRPLAAGDRISSAHEAGTDTDGR
jgi:hypothetical protein